MNIRKAVLPKETSRILFLLRLIELSHLPSPQEIENPNNMWFVFEQDGVILGGVAATNNRGEIAHIVVDPASQRNGIGSKLVTTAASYLKNTGHKRIWAQVRIDNSKSIGLFTKNGFTLQERLLTSREDHRVKLFEFILE